MCNLIVFVEFIIKNLPEIIHLTTKSSSPADNMTCFICFYDDPPCLITSWRVAALMSRRLASNLSRLLYVYDISVVVLAAFQSSSSVVHLTLCPASVPSLSGFLAALALSVRPPPQTEL